ncbi:MAG TPA: MBL fold metallo-hydrolase [Gemmatimonadaceae bacterium]|nr:MBL fold metallo-hydrolase [Gemmatimonadaceae bacterium]
MEIEFVGAAREVTGSCHVLRVGGRTVLLDCGMFQGRRSESAQKNLELPVPIEDIAAIVLSHAHIDHSGRLPFLVNRGFKGPIWATAATRDLCAVMLADSAHIQEKDAEFLARHRKTFVEPLYGMRDAAATQKHMNGVPYDQAFDVVPGVRCTFIEAGHILGSAAVVLDCEEAGVRRRLVFSGDIGRRGLAIIRDPAIPVGAQAVILESTYGGRTHESVVGARDRLAEIVRETAARGGRILIPAFAVGRTQELIYSLHQLARERRIPSIPIYVDSPLAIDATTVFSLHPDTFDRSEDFVREVGELFAFQQVRYTRDVSESKALNYARGPMVVIAGSGMAEGGRILHHLANGASDPRNTVLIVGFQAEHTLGRRIVERRPMIKVFGEEIPLRARVEIINGYSAHADEPELIEWVEAAKARTERLEPIWLVHGEPAAQDALSSSLKARGYDVSAPAPRDRVELQ